MVKIHQERWPAVQKFPKMAEEWIGRRLDCFSGRCSVVLFQQTVHQSSDMNSFASACKQGGVNFGRFLSVQRAVTATELFLEFGNTSKQFLDELVTILHVIRQGSRFVDVVVVLGRVLRHGQSFF